MSTIPTLTTTRLILRPFVADDAVQVEVLAGAFEIADTTLNIPHPYPAGGGAEWISTHPAAWEAGTGVTLAIAPAGAPHSVIGAIGLAITPKHHRAELGYWIAVPHWGHGYATEAGGAVLACAFVHLGLNRVQAQHLTRNPASGRVMQKLGMRPEGVLRQSLRKWDRFEDVACYAILASEWSEATRAR